MRKMTVSISSLLALGLLTSVCQAGGASAEPVAGAAPSPAVSALNDKAPQEKADSKPTSSLQPATRVDALSGKVLEVFHGGSYTFFYLEKGGEKFWVATPPINATVGEEVSLQPGIEMRNFKSASLNRTFEQIFFSGGKALPPGEKSKDDDFLMKKAHSMNAAKSAGGTSPAVSAKPAAPSVKVEKAAAPNGYTVAELYEKSGDLNGKEVVVQGKVVKLSKQIMGKNWVHLQDGSGDSQKGTNNLVTTTQDAAVVGDVVTATGKLAKDKDFGGGYFYAVIIEETKLLKK